ncbi:unnamed protein product [Caenorhabditis brenneri]
MISKPILLILAVLVACAVAQESYKTQKQQVREAKYNRFLANGVDKKYVDQIRDLDTIYDKEKAEAKKDREKYREAVKNLEKGYEEIRKKMPKDQLKNYYESLWGY